MGEIVSAALIGAAYSETAVGVGDIQMCADLAHPEILTH